MGSEVAKSRVAAPETPVLDVSVSQFDCAAVGGVSVRHIAGLAGTGQLEYKDVVDFMGGQKAASSQGLTPTVYVDLLAELIKSRGNSFNIPKLFAPSQQEQLTCESPADGPMALASLEEFDTH